MLARISHYVRQHHIGFLALFIALGGTAWAIENNSVKSKHIAPDAAKGVDIDEATLEQVPEAADADTLDGFQVRKINYVVPVDDASPYAQVLSVGGLEITAACRSFGDHLDVKAYTTTEPSARMWITAVSNFEPHETSGGGGFFTPGDPVDVDNRFPSPGNAGTGMGTIHYYTPDGIVVVAHLNLEERLGAGGLLDCRINGTAMVG